MTEYVRNTLTGDLAPVNSELTKIKTALDSKMDRKPVIGQANQMEEELDMNGYEIINYPAATGDSSLVRRDQVSGLAPVQSVNGKVGNVVIPIPGAGTGNVTVVDTFAELEALSPSDEDVYFQCVERANAFYVLQDVSYVAQTGDATFANSRVAKLEATNIYNLAWFGVDLTGTTDEQTTLQAALNLVPKGGELFFTGHLKTSSVTVPDGVKLRSFCQNPMPFNGAELVDSEARLTLTSGSTVTLGEASGLTNVVLLKDGITIPANASQIAAWTGTAVLFADQKSGAYVKECFIGGFQFAIDTGATNVPKTKIVDVAIDCRNGIRIQSSFDVTYVTRVHCWPFLSISLVGRVDADLERDGTAFASLGGDVPKFTDCFSYGYRNGFVCTDTNNPIFTNCGADNTPTHTVNPTSRGFVLDGTTKEPLLTNCQSAGQSFAGLVSALGTTAGYLQLNNCSFWINDTYQAQIVSGEYLISNSSFRGVLGAPAGIGLRIESTSKGVVENNIFSGCTTGVSSVAGAVPIFGNNIFKDCPTNYNRRNIPTVASASTITLEGERKIFLVSGTATITNIQNVLAYAGEEITLIFQSTAAVNETGNIDLSATPFNATAGDVLKLVSDGITWFESSRSVN